jgi:hypothetical protein
MSGPPQNRAPTKSFAANHAWDRNFYVFMVAMAWLGILRGFGAEVVTHVTEHKPAFALIVHFHAVVFVGWLVMFTVEVFLIRTKRLSAHKQLGFAMIWLAGLMTILGGRQPSRCSTAPSQTPCRPGLSQRPIHRHPGLRRPHDGRRPAPQVAGRPQAADPSRHPLHHGRGLCPLAGQPLDPSPRLRFLAFLDRTLLWS